MDVDSLATLEDYVGPRMVKIRRERDTIYKRTMSLYPTASNSQQHISASLQVNGGHNGFGVLSGQGEVNNTSA